MDSKLSLGIDVGSETAKIAVLDPDLRVIEKTYRKHYGKPADAISEILREALKKFGSLRVCFTGVSGRFIAKVIDAPYVNEIVSQATATSKLYPQIRTIIEIGGEDSKLIFLDRAGRIKDFSLNSICAAGTGSFLEQQAERLGLTISEFSELAVKSKRPSKIAGRCSVFAKSDMIHLQQIATPVEDIIAGLCYALARNFKATMFKGRPCVEPVSFQGGVAANKGMVKAFKDVLGVREILIPEHFEVTGAIGAAVKAREHDFYLSFDIVDRLSEIKAQIAYGLRPLSLKEADRCYQTADFASGRVENSHPIDAYLGIDVGSVSTNVVLIDSEGNLITKRYLPTAGRPLDAVKRGLSEIEQEGLKLNIRGVGVTGSGRYMIADFIGADVVKNEITAHARGAVHFSREVDTIFEIGGQDSKYIKLKDGNVVDFEMNRACAAGTGSFIEEQADKLGVSLSDFQRLAFSSQSPCKLGERCTVFMENSLVINLHKGAKKEDLIAGLCYSIVENYINRVVAGKPIGKKIFFQGGVAFNRAVVSAFSNYLTDKFGEAFEISIPPHHEVIGAIGAALLAKDQIKGNGNTKFKGFSIKDSAYSISSFECRGCPNYCEINRIRIEQEDRTIFYGGRCEKYEEELSTSKLPDPVRKREELLWKVQNEYRERFKDRKGPTAGIPYIFYFHDLLPFFTALLWELGFAVEVSGRTNKEIITKGIEKVPTEACFPLKVAYGHIDELIERGVDFIFLPSFINLNIHDEFERGLACPLVQTVPYVSRGLFRNIKFAIPRIDFSRGWDYIKKEIFDSLKDFIVIKNLDLCLSSAYERQKEFFQNLQREGIKYLETAKERKLGQRETVVLIGRAYNTFDQAMSLDVSGKLTRLNVLPIPYDMLPVEKVSIKEDWSNMYWKSGQRIIKASRFISKLSQVYPIFITNFSCGPDSFIINYFKQELLDHPYLILEIDEHSADAGLITRLEAFVDSVGRRQGVDEIKTFIPLFRKAQGDLSRRTIFIPRMADHAFALKAAFNYCGIDAEVMPPSDRESVELGRKHVLGGECFPYVVTLGDMLKVLLSSDFIPEKTAFFMPSGSGPCRFGQYNVSHRLVLKKLGFENVPVYSPQQDAQFYRDLKVAGGEFSLRAWQGVVAYGLLTKLLLQTRPYEKNRGESDQLYEEYHRRIFESLRSKNGEIETTLSEMRRDFENIEKYKDRKPLIGIVGEIFVRSNSFSNENLIRRLEALGAEVYLTPIEEWIHYVNKIALRKALLKMDKSAIIKILVNKFFQWKVERKYSSKLKGTLRFLHEPSVGKLFEYASPYVPDSFEGETVLSVGKTIDLIKRGASGIVNAMPFGCMPGAIVTALLRFIQRDYGVPVVSLAFDGMHSTVNELWLEAFIETIKSKGGE